MAKDEYVPFTGKLDAAPQFEPFDGTLDGEKPKPRNLAAVANDTVIEVANAAAGGVSSAANFIKPGNAVSGWIDKNIVKAGEDSQSDVTKAAKKQFRDEVENADGVMGELGAVGKYVVQNPLLSAAQAAGSFVGPGLAVKATGFAGKAAQLGAKGVERAGRAGGVAAGAAMAGGDAAGTAYELSTKAGATEDQAVAAGRQASVIPAVIGGVGGMFGAEKLLAGAKGFAGGATSRALKTGASEAVQEGIEEGATQYEGQRAAMPYDPSIDPSKGVAAAAGMGAALGGITGAGASLLTGRDTGQQPNPGTQTPPGQTQPAPAAGPTLALPAPERGVIHVGPDGTARTPAYQAPGYVGDVTDVEAKTPRAQAADFASILDTDNVYSGWSNVQDGSDRATMRDQMDYVGRTYGGKTTPENAAEVAADLHQQFKWFRAASPEQKRTAINALMVPAAPIDPVRESVAAAAEQGGALSGAALTAIDTGVTQAMQPAPEQAPPQISLEEADARDQAAYEQFFANHDSDPVVGRYLENDDDIPDFDAASNVSDEDFLRSLDPTITDQEIQDEIASASQPAIPQSRPAVDAGAQANEPAGPREGAGGNQAAQGQVTPRQPDNFTGTPTATMGEQGATARPGPAFGLKDALAQIRAKKQQEAANAKAATSEAAPAATAVSAARPGAVEAAGVARSKLLAGLDQTGATREMVLDARLKDAQYRLSQLNSTTGILPADRASRLSGINQEIADLTDVRAQARELDERDRRDGNTRSMLQGARQELDAAVRAGAITPEAAQAVASNARSTGNAADASEAIFAAVDSSTTGATSEPTPPQAIQASPQPAQAAAAPAAGLAPTNTAAPTPAGASTVRALNDGAPAENTGAQAAPAAGAQGAAPAEPEFTTIKTVYGDSVTVRTADLNSDKPRLRQYTKDGKSKAVPAIHRDNLDLTGDKRASSAKEDADNPFFNVITTKDGSTFASQAAASRELNRLAMGETHEVVAASEVQDGAQGFVIRRKLDAPAQETTHNGARIYPTKVKVGDEVKSMWAVESPDNQRRRTAGERTIGGDSLHDTIEQAKAAAEREAKRDAEQQAAKAEQDAADKERLDAVEARKAANRPKTLMEHRKDAVLSKQVLDSETGNVMTRREWVKNKVAAGLKTSITQEDKIKPMSRMQIFRADNRQQAEHDRKVKEAGKKDVYWLGDFEVTKIEYDYAQELKAQREAAPQAEAEQLNQYLTAESARKEPAAAQDADVQPSQQDFIPALDGWDGSEPTSAVTGQRPAFATAASASPESESSQGGSNARGQDASVPPAAPAAQPITRADVETAKKQAAEDNYLDTLFGGGSESASAAQAAPSKRRIDANKIVPALRQLADQKQAEADDWAGRVYRNNTTQIDLRGDGPSRQDSMSTNSVNESRRRRAVEALTQQANAASKLADRVENGTIDLQSRLDSISDTVDSDMRRDGGRPMIGASRADMFEGYISNNLLGDDNYGHGQGTVARMLRDAYEVAAQPDTPKLTTAEAKSLMAWEDLGQKDGVKTHALTFYESQADKDAKRGRMIVARVTKEVDSGNWTVEGTGEKLAVLGMAKKKAEQVGMEKAVADGFVEQAVEAPKSTAKPAAAATNSAPIEDAGEKIGGARKDRWKERGLNLDDLNAMTEAEGAELATKANVWKPDYDALSEAAEPATAALVKTIYDRLAAKPKKNTPEGRRQYVQMMRIVRDVLTEAKGPDAVRTAYLEIRNRAGLNTMDPQAKTAARELLFSVYKGRSDPFVLDGGDLMKVKKMVTDGFPAKGEPWKSRLTVGRAEGGPGTTERGIELYIERSAEVGTPLTREQILGGFYRVTTKDNKTVAFAPTKADAEAAAATVYERDMKGKKDGKPEPVRPNLDELKRENLPQRIDRDVTSEDFVRDLGFRGVEFGLWSAQDERQRILNMAYDGLMDLAEIMGVPPKAMSLNGTLGMAFGARGGGRFAAHYEPGKLVINMTKIRGGGSMAHEWAHAMDHYFGELDKPDAYTTQARGASGWYSEDQYNGVPRRRMERVGNEWKNVEKMRLDNLRPEMAAAFDEVMRALFSKQVTKAEMVRSHELDLERTEALARNETQADLKAMYQNMAQNKRQALNELRGDPEGTMYAGRGRSDYASQAQALSGKSENGYWTRPTEMFARAFESWVFDKVTAMGARSDYLVHGVEEDRFAGGGYKGNPYPTGEERALINAAFDKLASTIQTKETDKGVALFSSADSTPPAKPLSLDRVNQLVQEALAGIRGAPPVEVTARPADVGLKVPAGSVGYGVTLRSGDIYVFQSAMGSDLDVFKTVFHELFHRGVRVLVPKGQYVQTMLDLAKGDSRIQQLAIEWKNTEMGQKQKENLREQGYTGAELTGQYEALAIEEALAAVAEEIKAEGKLGSKPKSMTIRFLANWLAKLADLAGMKKLAQGIRAMTYNEAERFVMSAIDRSGEPVQAGRTDNLSAKQAERTGDQTQTEAFKRWFGDSKVVDAEGKPLRVFHGTGGDFSVFSRARAGAATGAANTGMGFFFTDNAEVAGNYARMARDAQAIMPTYLSLQNPLRLEAKNMMEADRLLLSGLKPENDGAIIRVAMRDGGTQTVYMVREPGQIKSATGNRGTFDPSNADIRYRTKDENPLAQRIGAAIQGATVTNLKQRAGFKLTDYLGIGLQALGRRQIVDIYGDTLPLAEYNKLVQQMEADKNEGGAEADQLVSRWAKLDDERRLAEVMHDATLAQIDADGDVAYQVGDDKAKSAMLKDQFKALSAEAQKVYRDTRDSYKNHHNQVRNAIKERIERSDLKGERKAALLAQMDGEFFKAVKGVYFPLARFGQYVVTVKGADGKVESVSRAETMAEAQALRSNLLSAFPSSKGFAVGRVMLSKDFIADRDAVGRGFMTELYQVLDKQDMDAVQRAELEDTLGQLYLSSLPDLSWAKHGIHRKGTPGFSQDARRAFAQNMFHGARYLAKLRYSDLMQDELAAMQKHVDDWREVSDFDQPTAQRVVDEMNKRHEALMNPKSNALSTALTSFGFIFHLGLSPASAMVNLTQTALVAYPIMGAKWGFGKASAALLKASQQAAKGKNDITASLNADERAAYDEAVRAGTIDVTMAHDLAGIAQGEDAGVMWKLRPVMRWASFMFHHAERFNRQVTFVAAYRLAREAGADQKAAFEQATKATYDGHYDYSAANRPRIMQGNVAKVLLLFKQYGQNMVYTLVRNAQQSLKGATPEARAQARKALGGLLVMHGLAAGALGLPMVTTLLAAASMLGGDDDEPWDAQVALQNLLADAFGQKAAEVLAHGLSRLTPGDISGRVGLDKLIFPDLQEGLEGQRLAESAMAAALGPVAGIGINVLKGIHEMSEGRFLRGLETMAPSVARGPLKAWRYGNEGVRDKTGIVVQDEVGAAELLGQAAGFSPSSVRNSFEGKSAIVQYDRALMARRSALVEQYAMAAMAGDDPGKAEAREDIARFNEKNPNRRILPMQLAQSVRQREKRIREAQDGVYLPSKRRDALEAGRFALPD